MKTVTHLSKLPAADVEDGTLAIINGSHLILPDAGGESITAYDMTNLRMVNPDTLHESIVSTVYSLSAIWSKTKKLVG